MPAAVLALVLIAAALAGCGGDAAGEDPPAQASRGPGGGSVAALAQCRDWNAGTEAEKQATIADIRSSLTPQSQEESGTSLSDERAYELFEHSCAEDSPRASSCTSSTRARRRSRRSPSRKPWLRVTARSASLRR